MCRFYSALVYSQEEVVNLNLCVRLFCLSLCGRENGTSAIVITLMMFRLRGRLALSSITTITSPQREKPRCSCLEPSQYSLRG